MEAAETEATGATQELDDLALDGSKTIVIENSENEGSKKASGVEQQDKSDKEKHNSAQPKSPNTEKRSHPSKGPQNEVQETLETDSLTRNKTLPGGKTKKSPTVAERLQNGHSDEKATYKGEEEQEEDIPEDKESSMSAHSVKEDFDRIVYEYMMIEKEEEFNSRILRKFVNYVYKPGLPRFTRSTILVISSSHIYKF